MPWLSGDRGLDLELLDTEDRRELKVGLAVKGRMAGLFGNEVSCPARSQACTNTQPLQSLAGKNIQVVPGPHTETSAVQIGPAFKDLSWLLDT